MTKTSTTKKVAAAAFVLALALVGACSKKEGKDCSKTDDATLVTNVKAELSKKMPKLAKDINVASKDRVVTLTGKLNFEGSRTFAGDTAKGVECVKDVVNKIEVVRTAGACPPGQVECCCAGIGCECVDSRIGCTGCLPK